jgi:hypothetical protein
MTSSTMQLPQTFTILVFLVPAPMPFFCLRMKGREILENAKYPLLRSVLIGN